MFCEQGGLMCYRNEVKDILAIVDVFVLSSRREGTQIAVLEVMASGEPIVSTDLGGVSKVATDGVTGLLVGARESSGLAEKKCGSAPTQCSWIGWG